MIAKRTSLARGTWSQGWHVTFFAVLIMLASGDWSWPLPAPIDPVAYVIPITGVVDLGLAYFVDRELQEASDMGASAVILEIDTFGGRVDGAVLIRDDLLRARVPTVAFVNKRAISAGALIALAAEKIAMASGSTIGAATPVQMGQPGAPVQPVAEKTLSYMRKEFRATAESRGRPPLFAEAMVDADVKIPGVIEKGKLLTLTTQEALRYKFADWRADTIDAVLILLGLPKAEVHRTAQTWAESVVRFLTNPVVSPLLMTIGILGILVEIRTPGIGLPGAIGVASLALFFWGHWLVRLAGWEELVLVGLGIVLLVLELFVIPGFGIVGTIGLAALVSGLGLSLVGAGTTWVGVLEAVGQVALSLLVAIALSLVLLRFLPRLPFGRRLVLDAELPAGAGYESESPSDRRWLGKQGTAVSPLRPSGLAHLDSERVDVVSDGEFIEPGAKIEVIRVDGNRIVVRRAPQAARQGGNYGS